MSKYDILIDVDGVINAFSYNLRHEIPWGYSELKPMVKEVLGYIITFSDELLEELNLLHLNGDANFYWLTTWLDKAPTELAPAIGLAGEGWPVLGKREYERDYGGFGGKPLAEQNLTDWWKLDTIMEHAKTTDNHLIWIDDDINDSPDALAWIKENSDRVTAFSTKTHLGLTKIELDKIKEIISQ